VTATHRLLVTGATGAIGTAVLNAFEARPEIATIFALTHVTALHSPGGVSAVGGDIAADENLAMRSIDADSLADSVTGIVHLAADTRFSTPLEALRRTNVAGLGHVLAFARRCRRLDRVVVVSTTHVAGRRTGQIFEDDLDHDAGFVNPYEASKYEAEQLLRSAQPDLPVSVCRLSTVVGNSRTGEIARRGAIHHATLTLYAGLAPMIPGHESSPVDLLALETAADAIVILATDGFVPGQTWHLCAGRDTIPAGELIDLTMDVLREHRPAWRKKAIERPVFVDLDTFDLFCRSVNEVGEPLMRSATGIVSQFAPQLMFPKWFDNRVCAARLSGFELQRPDPRGVWAKVVKRLVESRSAVSD
jgi:nucleoside-diphosphate-sugar epimerase